VKSRCHAALWASAVAAVLAFLASTSPAVAGAITTGATTDPGALTTFTYELTSSVDIPAAQNSTSSTAPQPQVVLDIAPPGAVVALQTGTDSSNNPIFAQPLTPLASSAGVDSDLSNVAVFLKPPPGTSNSGSQELGLSFFGEGLKSAVNGGHLDFSLSVDKTLAAPVLTSPDPTISVAMLSSAPSSTTTTVATTTPTTTTTAPDASSVSTAIIPEPVSLALWSTVALAGLVQARVRAGRRRTA
jgi:hypothetical protein